MANNRFGKIGASVTGISVAAFIAADEAYLQEKFAVYITQKISEGYFTPKQPVDDIVSFLMAALSGITRNLILYKRYHIDEPIPMADSFNGDNAARTLCTALILLLGGNEKLSGVIDV